MSRAGSERKLGKARLWPFDPSAIFGHVDKAAELLDAYSEAETAAAAEHILDQLASEPQAVPPDIGEYYDELATYAAEEDDHAVAVSAQRKAIEHGCLYPEIGREMLGWYLLLDGKRDQGEAQFAKLRAERPDDPHLMVLIGNARRDAGYGEDALKAFDEALVLARRVGEAADVAEALAEREDARGELGLPPDEDDLLARQRRRTIPDVRVESEEVRFSYSWFPRDQHAAAIARWPELAGDLSDADDYCREMENRFRMNSAAIGRHPRIAPIDVDRLLAFAEETSSDPSAGATRAAYAAELDRLGETLIWPPGRNEPCWCGSGRKYKRCCGGV